MTKKDPLNEGLFNVLACPACRSGLGCSKDKKGLICKGCRARYPIQEGIPMLLPAVQR